MRWRDGVSKEGAVIRAGGEGGGWECFWRAVGRRAREGGGRSLDLDMAWEECGAVVGKVTEEVDNKELGASVGRTWEASGQKDGVAIEIDLTGRSLEAAVSVGVSDGAGKTEEGSDRRGGRGASPVVREGGR